MKKIYTAFLIFNTVLCFGQKQNNNWCFGYHAGVSFNSGNPVSFSGGATSTTFLEGVSTISDVNGNLLFYTDGSTVWNKANLPMPNGSGLLGNYSTSEGVLIVPQPGNDSIYYVFTLDIQNGPNGLHYSVVDMKLAGGMGDVSQLNIPLEAGTLYSEKMIGIFDSSGTNVWVITHTSYSNAFHSYHVTSAGVNATPVSSNVGQTYADNDAVGTMHCTLDGSRIAVSYWDDLSGYEVFDFDKESGQLSNPLFITSPNYLWAYSVCFSPDGRYLYGGCYNTSTIYQFDLHQSSPVGALITTSSYSIGDMQLGSDSIIYISLPSNAFLSAIESPDSSGTACNFVTNAVSLGGTAKCWLGLNNYIYPSAQATTPLVANFQTSITAICANGCINFNDLSTNATSWQWSFAGADDSTSTAQNPQSVCYATPGTYNVTLIASNDGGSDTVTFTDYITVKAAPPSPIITQHHDTLYCSADSSYSSYQWYIDSTLIGGATDTSLVITAGGNYNLQVSNKNGCQIAVGINIILGVQNYANDNVISLYPNPAANQLTIHTSSTANWQNTMVSVVNVLGQETSPKESGVLRTSVGDASINVSGLSAGIYFVQITTEKERYVGKFVKE